MNDTLPQELCSTCISFINKSMKFRKKCEESQKMLLENRVNGIKIEHFNLKLEENSTAIDISDSLEDDFKDFDDNITLDTLQSNNDDIISKNESLPKTEITFDTKQTEINEKPIDLLLIGKRRRKCVKTVRGKTTDKKENIKERIECEYCHKILTSKLSLRNHYKIHTGFDVVCEVSTI